LKDPPLGIPGASAAPGRAQAEVAFLDPQQATVAARKSVTVDLHFHIAAHGSERMCEVALEEAHAIWRRLTGTGHADAQLANSPRAVARYITKATRDPRSIGNFVAYAPTPTVK